MAGSSWSRHEITNHRLRLVEAELSAAHTRFHEETSRFWIFLPAPHRDETIGTLKPRGTAAIRCVSQKFMQCEFVLIMYDHVR